MLIFIVLIFLWQIYLKIFPPKEEKELLFENLKESFKSFSNEIKNLKLPKVETIIENMEIRESQKNKMTNEEIKKLKEKVLEYINKSQ